MPRLFLLAALVVLAGCPAGAPTGAECPPVDAPTYDGFAKKFFRDHCLLCHSTSVVGETARYTAPEDVNFDTPAAIRALKDDIDQAAAKGPDAHNRRMPPTGARPSDEERELLAQWLACGAKD